MTESPDSQRRREECERKARRGEMDPRLEFYVPAADGRHRVAPPSDHGPHLRGEHADEINQLFPPEHAQQAGCGSYEDMRLNRAINKPGPSRRGASSSQNACRASGAPQPAPQAVHQDGGAALHRNLHHMSLHQHPETVARGGLPQGSVLRHTSTPTGWASQTSIERLSIALVLMQALAYPNNIESEDEDMSCNLIKSQLLAWIALTAVPHAGESRSGNHFNA
ncbi:hypothetical protein quinque_007895 [Culex quinquefasciatus]